MPKAVMIEKDGWYITRSVTRIVAFVGVRGDRSVHLAHEIAALVSDTGADAEVVLGSSLFCW
jgi:hypothetical protein